MSVLSSDPVGARGLSSGHHASHCLYLLSYLAGPWKSFKCGLSSQDDGLNEGWLLDVAVPFRGGT